MSASTKRPAASGGRAGSAPRPYGSSTLATAWIHATLGSTLFLLNACGYVVLAAAMVLPGPVARVRWLARYALMGFAATTIAAWLAFGARFDLAYLSKGIEVAYAGQLDG